MLEGTPKGNIDLDELVSTLLQEKEAASNSGMPVSEAEPEIEEIAPPLPVPEQLVGLQDEESYIEEAEEQDEVPELIAPIKKGYFIKTINHGSGMSTFTIAPSLAYEIVDGKLGRPVQISVLTGSVFETLGLIDGLTRDVHLLSIVTGGCGKMEQMNLPVGFGGPYVRVSSMNVQ